MWAGMCGLLLSPIMVLLIDLMAWQSRTTDLGKQLPGLRHIFEYNTTCPSCNINQSCVVVLTSCVCTGTIAHIIQCLVLDSVVSVLS